MDSHAFASLAHVRILLLPVGSIRHSTFEKFAAEVKVFDDIRLGDIPADQKDEKARFMPNPLSKGHLHLSFPSHPPPLTHSSLSLFRPSHFPLGVIGIGVCSQSNSPSTMLDQFNASLLDVFPAGSLFPLAKNCFIFEDSDGTTNLNLGDNIPGLVVIPGMMGNKKLYIGTLLADLCSHILGEFGRVVHMLESPIGNEYLNSALFPTLPSLSEMPQQLENGSDFFAPLPSHSSQPELGGSAHQSRAQANLNLKRNSSTGPSLGPAGNTNSLRQSTLGVPGAKSKRSSGIGAASSPGRLFKVLADFFLLSGRTEDATVWYTEAIVLFKSPQDAPWHASALEGLATISVIEAWVTGHGLAGSFSNGQEPWTDISDKLVQATALYYKFTPPTSDMDQTHFYLAYLYCTAVLRQTTLFFSIWSAKGWGPLAFTTMLQPGVSPYLPPTLAHSEHNTTLNLERLCSVTGISRATIAGLLAQAHGPWLLHLGPRERLAVLETMAGIYACLGYQRKEAYILREVLGCVMDLLVCGREENRGTPRPSPGTGVAGLGIRGVSFGERSTSAEQGSVGVRHNDYVEGNDSILRVLKYVCRVLGINLEAVKLVDAHFDGHAKPEDENGSNPNSIPPFQPDDDALEPSHDAYGWPELQIGVIREAIAVAESLPDYPTVAQIALSALKTMHPVLTTADQYHLYATSTRALTTAQRRGDTKQIEYWAGRPIVSVAISPLPFVRLPIEKPMSILSARLSDINPILTGTTDHFLYNPRRSLSAQGKALVVQNETLEFVVTLQNPFVFDLELQTLALSTSGVPFEANSMSVVLPANSFQAVSIIGKSLGIGNLVIRGCTVQAPGGMSREFVLPLSTDEEEDRLSRRRSAIDCEIGRSKYSGLDSRPWERAVKRTSTSIINKKSFRFLECKVVPEQPLLRIRRTSLTHGAVMLYNGEMSIIRLTLENVSNLPIDFLRLSFDDSTIAPAQQALADGNLSVFDTYETEYDLINRPTFSWQSPKEFKEVAPGQKVVLTVVCFGKVGCISGTIHVAYAHVHRPLAVNDTPSEVFYTRQLTYPVLVTVYHMLECHGMDVLPFDGTESRDSDEEEMTHSRRLLLSVDDEAGWCLFSIDVRNTYGLPFEVTVERDQEGTPKISTTLVVPPGSTSRIVLPVKKFLLPGEHVSQPIPTLSDRQFVVTKSNLTSAEEKNQRELFWYREELFKFIRGHWHEAGGTRSGSLSLRQQRMTLPMLETIRTETARVKMSLVRYSGEDGSVEETIAHKGSKFTPRPNEFVYLQTQVINLSPSPLTIVVDLEIDPAEHIIYEGVLLGVPLGHLEPGESRTLETAVVFLSRGRFEVRAEVRILGAPRSERRAGVGQLRADVRE